MVNPKTAQCKSVGYDDRRMEEERGGVRSAGGLADNRKYEKYPIV